MSVGAEIGSGDELPLREESPDRFDLHTLSDLEWKRDRLQAWVIRGLGLTLLLFLPVLGMISPPTRLDDWRLAAILSPTGAAIFLAGFITRPEPVSLLFDDAGFQITLANGKVRTKAWADPALSVYFTDEQGSKLYQSGPKELRYRLIGRRVPECHVPVEAGESLVRHAREKGLDVSTGVDRIDSKSDSGTRGWTWVRPIEAAKKSRT